MRIKNRLRFVGIGVGLLAIPCAVAAVTFTNPVTVPGLISVVGALSKGSGTFVIDHPLDPKNKLLYHSFVESPDVKNLYDGVVTLDANGEATVTLPNYFLVLNTEFRYLAAAMSEPMPNLHIATEIHRPYLGLWGPVQFSIAGGTANGTISWQVTGVRHDPLIQEYPIVPEVNKGPDQIVDIGECLFEPLCE